MNDMEKGQGLKAMLSLFPSVVARSALKPYRSLFLQAKFGGESYQPQHAAESESV